MAGKSPREAAKAKAASRQRKYKTTQRMKSALKSSPKTKAREEALSKYRATRKKTSKKMTTSQKLLPFWVQDSGPNIARLKKAMGIGSKRKKKQSGGGGG